jgi:hypothetical protein
LVTQAAFAQLVNVTHSGGDTNRPISWTGQILTVPGQAWTNYTVKAFGDKSPAFVDRTHVWTRTAMSGTNSPMWAFPAYLQDSAYVMTANDNRDNTNYSITLTLSQPAFVYLFIDNRAGGNDGNSANPPMLDTSTNMMGLGFMTWVLDNGFQPKITGVNRQGTDINPNFTIPDELGMDEGNNGTIDNWGSVYFRRFGAGTVVLGDQVMGGRNMYGLAIHPIPEPAGLMLLAGLFGVWAVRRRR